MIRVIILAIIILISGCGGDVNTSSRGIMPEWPNDADGDALRRVWNDGADFNVKHVVDFQIEFDNPKRIADAQKMLKQKYQEVELYDETDEPYLQISKPMLLQYDALLKEQEELSDLTSKFGGKCEAWGVLIE